eukprot:Skav232911  [mRNA]  locus=scaffold1477:555114:558059:- [translate_table: standard]
MFMALLRLPLVHSIYSSAVEGYVDLGRRSSAAFGWDDVVVLTSPWATDDIATIARRSQEDQRQVRVELLGRSPTRFVCRWSWAQLAPWCELPSAAWPRNNGAFFRSAQSRRELNYWLPGLNAGCSARAVATLVDIGASG